MATRVLVLDDHTTIGLAISRALGRAGYRVDVATGTGRAFASRSRYCAGRVPLPDPCGPAAPFATALASAVAAGGHACVIACDDPTIERLASIAPAVPTVPALGAPRDVLVDKLALARLAAEAGARYPETIAVAGDGAAALAAAGLPAIVKGATSARADDERVEVARGATVVGDADAGRAAIAAVAATGIAPIVQRRLPIAAKVNAVVVRDASGTVVRYAHEVAAEHPVAGGRGVSLRSIDPDGGVGADAIGQLERLCVAAGYAGVAQAEFYVVDGAAWLIEVNARCWGSTWFGELQGLRVVERAVRHATGLPPLPPARYVPGRRFHFAPGVVRWLRDASPERGSRWRLVRTIRPWDGVDVVSLRDPRPMLPVRR